MARIGGIKKFSRSAWEPIKQTSGGFLHNYVSAAKQDTTEADIEN